MDKTLEELVQKAKEGNQKSFDELFNRYKGSIHNLFLRSINDGLSEDHVQNIFMEAFRNIQQLRNNSAFGGWIHKIASNYIIDCYRDRGKQKENKKLPKYRILLLDIIDVVDRECTKEDTLRIALSLLPQKQRDLVEAFYIGGQDKKLGEICEQLEIGGGSFFKSLEGAYKNLKVVLPYIEKYDLSEEDVSKLKGWKIRGSYQSKHRKGL